MDIELVPNLIWVAVTCVKHITIFGMFQCGHSYLKVKRSNMLVLSMLYRSDWETAIRQGSHGYLKDSHWDDG